MTQLEPLTNIFSSRVLQVPDYQRGFAWETQQIEDLIRDLESLAHIPSHKNHFTGTVVLHKKIGDPISILGRTFHPVHIVDGQQRLTTLVIFLSCIADALLATDEQDAVLIAEDIKETFLEVSSSQDRVFRLRLQEETDQFFKLHVLRNEPLSSPRSSSERRLLSAKKHITAYLDEEKERRPAREWPEFLADLKSRIAERLGFVIYEVDNEAEVGVMFEVMNSRGKALTQLEKVKNYLLYAAAKVTSEENLSSLSRDINETWRSILEMIELTEGADEDQFLQYHWIVYPGAPSEEDPNRVSNVHRALKQTVGGTRFEDSERVVRQIGDYIDNLRTTANAYRDLIAPSSESGQLSTELRHTVQSIHRIGRPATVLPLLMILYRGFRQNEQVLAELFGLCEAFIFRSATIGYYANAGRNRVYRFARQCACSEELSATEVRDWLLELINDYCPLRRFESSLRDPERNYYQWNQVLFFLYEYERYLKKQANQNIPIDWEALSSRDKQETIEHILPQGDSTLEKNCWSRRFTAEEHASYRHRLGNLCITNWNSTYYNRCFKDKKGGPEDERGYAVSGWSQERELTMYSAWNPESIEDRHNRLVTFALIRWGLPGEHIAGDE